MEPLLAPPSLLLNPALMVKIVPKDFEVSYYYDVKATPQNNLKYMIFMNIELEKIESL